MLSFIEDFKNHKYKRFLFFSFLKDESVQTDAGERDVNLKEDLVEINKEERKRTTSYKHSFRFLIPCLLSRYSTKRYK